MGRTERLVAQTDAKRRVLCLGEHVDGHAGLCGRPGPRRDDDAVRVEFVDALNIDSVVPADRDIVELADVLDQIVGEGIVVVDNEYHRIPSIGSVSDSTANDPCSPSASSTAVTSARALSSVSLYSASGTESCTMPLPTRRRYSLS